MLSSFSRSPSIIRSTGIPVQRLTTAAMSWSVTSSRSIAPLDACGGFGELLLELGDAAVLQLAGLGEVAAALRLLELDPGGVELLLDLGLAGDLLLFRLPALGQLGRLLLEVGELALERLQPVLRRGVAFLLQRLALDLELDDPPVEILDLLGLGFDLHPEPRRRPRPSGRSPCRAGSGR